MVQMTITLIDCRLAALAPDASGSSLSNVVSPRQLRGRVMIPLHSLASCTRCRVHCVTCSVRVLTYSGSKVPILSLEDFCESLKVCQRNRESSWGSGLDFNNAVTGLSACRAEP